VSTSKRGPRSARRKKPSLRKQTVKDLAPGKGERAAAGAGTQVRSQVFTCGLACILRN
jgi:hypothetical protein